MFQQHPYFLRALVAERRPELDPHAGDVRRQRRERKLRRQPPR